jgi:hypothetical protein
MAKQPAPKEKKKASTKDDKFGGKRAPAFGSEEKTETKGKK